MNPRCSAVCALGAALVLCAACGGASTASTRTHTDRPTSAARSPTPKGSPEASAVAQDQTREEIQKRQAEPAGQQQRGGRPPAPSPTPEESNRPFTAFEKRLGPFALAPGYDVFVIVHSRRFEEPPGTSDEAVEWVEIRDAAGVVQYRRDYAGRVERGGLDERCSVDAKMLAGNNGRGILVNSQCEPSTPLGGGSWRLFGLRNGRVAPVGKELLVEGDVERFVPGTIRKQGAATMILADMLEFKVFTGNFFVIVPLRVSWLQGKLEPGMVCYEQGAHGLEEGGCEVPVVDVGRVPGDQEMTFVRLFPEADERMIPAHVVVRRDSQVEFLGAMVKTLLGEHEDTMTLSVADDPWLHVRVDGREGWIHTQEDFLAIGLPQAG
jgi:hypothetical protein